LDLTKARVVARFELMEALRSRSALFMIGLYAIGAAVGAWIFVHALDAAEQTARNALAEAMRVPPESLPKDLVREKALPRIASTLEDERLRDVLLTVDPLGIFYGFMAQNLVPGLLLLVASGTHAADLESGAARYALFRVDRASWALGKSAGQAGLLATGLLVGALVTYLVGRDPDAGLGLAMFTSLGRASLSAWLYGLCFLGLFSGVSMVSETPLRARGASFMLLCVCSIGHAVVTSDALKARAPGFQYARWVFPAEYKDGLWLTDPVAFLVSVLGLATIGAAGFALALWFFERRDA
jgi:hypothetical protein